MQHDARNLSSLEDFNRAEYQVSGEFVGETVNSGSITFGVRKKRDHGVYAALVLENKSQFQFQLG
ncbi:hypothetical protein DV706_14250 [Natronorubrum bangense]|uniref:Uncharacterized protein n=2 Tax=Natronorubrum bangense TaxID=61858 RepID=L9WKJ8_9EURY|nr:hypothetical protein C494_07875 [Natronorubrum bangense JCM 10635]QCC55529.1 hypothetical protein DV706_14250 [Natronorubrum bangense]